VKQGTKNKPYQLTDHQPLKFYRRLSKIKAISFDLDDTLYNNRPIMLSIEKQMKAYFSTTLPEFKLIFSRGFWFSFRQQAIEKQPNLVHDVVAVRFETYFLALKSLGLAEDIAKQHAQMALDHFISLRSNFVVPNSSHQLLASLSKVVPLIAISNGNVDTKALKIDQYFKYIYHAGFQGDSNSRLLKQKPESDMFTLACENLRISPQQLLHVGDCGYADIEGALRAQCQTAWLPKYKVGKPIKVLPHIEISNISQLEMLLS